MKNSFALASLAASIGQVSAVSFGSSSSFSCPANTDNKCIDKQIPGFDWSDLSTGDFSSYGGFQWSGFTCQDSFGKRDGLVDRSFSGKCITGSASPDAGNSPSFSCDSNQGVDKTSVVEFHVVPEFDCDLEFHYGMPDGSSCKHRSACSSSGSIIQNTQCGGAKNVTVVYPSQPSKPKPTCSFAIPSISFDCSTASTTKTVSTTSYKATSVATTTSSAGKTTYSATVPSSSSSFVVKSSTYVVSTPTTTSTSAQITSSTKAVETSSTTYEAHTITKVTSYQTASTVRTTVTSVITSCASSVYGCGKNGTTSVTTLTIDVSTTLCPVTETITSVSTATYTAIPVKSTTETAPVSYTATTTASTPVETLPCPDVVPSCLNTWLFSVGCKDNTDSACYCPDSLFVENIFTCMYAHGETDTIVSEAISYFQGICAPWIPTNPGIATGAATITTILTALPTTTAVGVYTTIEVTATTVVPCTTEGGSIITGSSTTQVITNTLTVPQVGFTTYSAGTGPTSVAIVPGQYSTAVATATGAYPTGAAGTTLVTAKPTGSSTAKASSTTTTGFPVVTAGAAHVGSGLGFLGVAFMAAAAL